MQSEDIKPSQPEQFPVIENKDLSLFEALLPVFVLILMLAYNILVFGDLSLNGSNQFILLMGASFAAIVGFRKGVSYAQMLEEVSHNVKSTSGAILILLMVGALSGTWLISGIIPSMIYYGLQLLSPGIFLAASLVICSIISLATGSSWSTSATVGIALIGIGNTLGISPGMTAGAVISGAYFGDKISPLSDTTNLAAAMAGADLFDHVRYMLISTIPSVLIAFIIFLVIGLGIETGSAPNITDKLQAIDSAFTISPWLFAVPLTVIFLITRKTEPLIALLTGALLGGVAAIVAQPDIVVATAGGTTLDFTTAYKGVMNALTIKTSVSTTNPELNDLFTAKGMQGMMGTIWLILCAMVFGGVMDAIGALTRISQASRTLEDSGTVTSVLVPWNTCGAYNAGVLGVATGDYFMYAIFNWLSPLMTLLIAGMGFRIKKLDSAQSA